GLDVFRRRQIADVLAQMPLQPIQVFLHLLEAARIDTVVELRFLDRVLGQARQALPRLLEFHAANGRRPAQAPAVLEQADVAAAAGRTSPGRRRQDRDPAPCGSPPRPQRTGPARFGYRPSRCSWWPYRGGS